MQALELQTTTEQTACEQYLGFRFEPCGPWFTATPTGDWGTTLVAESLPKLRKKVWMWWNIVK